MRPKQSMFQNFWEEPTNFSSRQFSKWNWMVSPEPVANQPLSHSWPEVSLMAGVCQIFLACQICLPGLQSLLHARWSEDETKSYWGIMTIFPAFAPAKASWLSSAPRSKSGGFLKPLSFLSAHKIMGFSLLFTNCDSRNCIASPRRRFPELHRLSSSSSNLCSFVRRTPAPPPNKTKKNKSQFMLVWKPAGQIVSFFWQSLIVPMLVRQERAPLNV